VTLSFCRDLRAADWIARSDLPWQRLVCFGPAGFPAYARVRFLPDPTHPGQSENDVVTDARPEPWAALLEVLGAQTSTAQDCWFLVWDGFGHSGPPLEPPGGYDGPAHPSGRSQPDATPGLAPRAAGHRPSGAASRDRTARVVIPHRVYWLFHGPLDEVGDWDTARHQPDHLRLGGAEPAFVWPDDHAWCVARDVDPHWAGIGGSKALVDRLQSDPRLDAVVADPTQPQPSYG
jgi:hypothetical protein